MNLSQSPTKAESPFTAFSPLFQYPANSRKPSADHSKQLSSPKPTQTYTKMGRNSPPINLTCPTNAQKSLKTSEINQKTAQQFQDLPPRNFASNQLPPQKKHTQKSRFHSQIKQTTSGNLTLATATPTIHSFSPVFTSKNQNSLVNSVTEVNPAGSPAAPASQTLYDVVCDANVRDDKVSARGGIGNAPKCISHPPQRHADSTFSACSAYSRQILLSFAQPNSGYARSTFVSRS